MSESMNKEKFENLEPNERAEYLENMMSLEDFYNIIECLEDNEIENFGAKIYYNFPTSFFETTDDDFKVEICKAFLKKGGMGGRMTARRHIIPCIVDESKKVEMIKLISDDYHRRQFVSSIKDLKLREELISYFDSPRLKKDIILTFDNTEDRLRLVSIHLNDRYERYDIINAISTEDILSYIQKMPDDDSRYDFVKNLFSDDNQEIDHKLENFIDAFDSDKTKSELIFELMKEPKERKTAIENLEKHNNPYNGILREAFKLDVERLEKLKDMDQEKLKESFDDKQWTIFEGYKNIDNKNIAEIVIKFFSDNQGKDIDVAGTYVLVDRIMNSNYEEISRCSEPILKDILREEDPIKALEQIESVFLRNDISYLRKVFRVFKYLHTSPDSYKNFSPTLNKLTTQVEIKEIDSIIFADLLKCSMGSNNRNLKKFIKDIEKGHQLLIDIQNKDILIKDLDNTQKYFLKRYFEKIENFLNIGIKYEYSKEDLQTRYNNIMTRLDEERINYKEIPDMIIKRFSGISAKKIFDMAKTHDEGLKNKDDKNRARSKEPFALEEGDFLKGLNSYKYLGDILQNGSVSKEFLGSSADSDSTPLDTDLARISSEDMENKEKISQIIGSTIAADYGPIWCVLKNDSEQIEITTPVKVSEQPKSSKVEAFYTGVLDPKTHYGIRVGFPSSYIDYFVVDGNVKEIGFEIAKNGFYIPVVNGEGELVFSPEDYDRLRKKMAGLEYYDEYEYQVSPNLINGIPHGYENAGANNIENNREKSKIIESLVREAVTDFKRTMGEDISADIIEFIDIGPTGRGTPDEGGFNFIMKIDNSIISNPKMLNELKQKILEKLVKKDSLVKVDEKVTADGDFRLRGVNIGENSKGEDVIADIDITFVRKTNKDFYSSDRCIKERLKSIYGKDKAEYFSVIDNILFAKKYLEKAGVYNPNGNQVGLDAVGIENWILQNGGSFIDAVNEFLEEAEGKDFFEFKKSYCIWDFGENYISKREGLYTYDNFIEKNMNEEVYEKMVTALREYKQQYDVQQGRKTTPEIISASR